MDGNILTGGIEGLNILKDKLIQLDRFQNDNSQLYIEEEKLEKAIGNKEKDIAEEIANTTRRRKEEVESTYDQEIEKTRERIKKIQNKKEKAKNAQVSERIEIETSDLREEYEQLKVETKSIFKQAKVPSFCNTRIFYGLYMPKGIGDYGIILVTLLLILLVIPCGIYFLVLPNPKTTHLILIYVVTILLFGGLYLLVGNKTKDKYYAAIKEVRVIRTKMLKNKIKRNKIRKKILKDKDESIYGLDQYDKDIAAINEEIKSIEEQKKEAISNFENNTRLAITDEIKGRYKEEQINLKSELNLLTEKVKNNEENIKYLSLEIADNYEAYLGKEFMNLEKINVLIEIIENHSLSSVSEAIGFYKKTRA